MKVHRDEIDWLIVVTKTVSDEDLKNEAIEKLASIGIDIDKINSKFEFLKDYKSQKRAFDKASKIQSSRNENKSYTVLQSLIIILLSLFVLGLRIEYGNSATELRRSNYIRMANQRLFLLILGVILWISFTIGAFIYFNSQWEREIDKVDINE